MIKGVLFDMDGVLVDSEEYICRASIEMFRGMGINAKPDDFTQFVGMGENRYIGGVAEKYGLKVNINEVKARTYAIYETLVKGKLKALPGALQFIESCRCSGLRLALATSTDKVKMEINLREIGLSQSDFDSVINGLEVERKKPFPDIYLMAAERIGLDPSECLVAEDAVSGVRAAKSAGCKCLALLTSFTAPELSEADWICNTLADVPSEALLW
jgi:HAD superfamily hydrolase (TIGR01509 family)